MVMQEMTNKAGKHNTSRDEICSDKDIISCLSVSFIPTTGVKTAQVREITLAMTASLINACAVPLMDVMVLTT